MSKVKIIRLEQTDSTNRWLKDYSGGEESDITVAVADSQTAGRGCGTNTWESEPGKNLTFSLLVYPSSVPPNRQFVLSMAKALALKAALNEYLPEGITLKWPNDVYWHDRKISGTLIELSVSGGSIQRCILGTGININQRTFTSDAPNPVSLVQVTGRETPLEEVLDKVIRHFRSYYGQVEQGRFEDIMQAYRQAMYRHEGFHRYRDSHGEFSALITGVEPDGHLLLRDDEGRLRRYAFKEVTYMIE